MKKIKYFLTTFTFFTFWFNGKAQDTDDLSKIARNDINVYVGIYDLNINYERNIIQSAKSYSNIRVGYGYVMNNFGGEGRYIGPAFVHLLGKGNGHVEFDVGIKYMLTNTIVDPDFSDTVIPDIFVGYRYETPSNGLVLRAGLNYPTVLNIGVGYKF